MRRVSYNSRFVFVVFVVGIMHSIILIPRSCKSRSIRKGGVCVTFFAHFVRSRFDILAAAQALALKLR